jgi:hypothetical protein
MTEAPSAGVMTVGEREAASRASPAGRLRLAQAVDVGALYPGFYYAPLDTIAGLPAAALIEAVLPGGPGPVPPASPARGGLTRGPYPRAQFAVSLDPPQRFDPELSMREPVELQVWPDGSFTVEIEFTGDDIRTAPAAGGSLGETLAEWAAARSWRLDRLFNDRGRSLPDIWNARFVMPDTSASVGSAVEFAGHAIGVAESCQRGGARAERTLALLRAGDAEGLLGAPATADFQPLPGPLPEDAASQFGFAAEVCAVANSVPGGLLVLGLERGTDAAGTRVSAVRPFPLGQGVERVASIVRSMVFPEPAEFLVEAVPVASEAAGAGLIAVSVPPQDQILKPFMVHGSVVGGSYQAQFASIVERRGVTIYAQPIAALHAQIAAGRALLRREPPGDME